MGDERDGHVTERTPSSVLSSERPQLVSLAYRMLGTMADAEDVVGAAGVRWLSLSAAERADIRSPGAWLTTVTSRLCLDVLDSARVRREHYVGAWIPEPVPGALDWLARGRLEDAMDPADRVTLDESISMAFLVVLDSMTPAERVAFVLHDVFGYRYAEIGEIVGRSEAACRQLASSGRRRVRGAAIPPSSAVRDAEVVRRFKVAWEARDLEALVALLDPDARSMADGGGLASAEVLPMRGGARIARACVDYAGRMDGATMLERTVNGRPGLVAQRDGATLTVYAFGVVRGRITDIWAIRNPEKLRLWS